MFSITSFPTTVILEDRKKYEREVGEAYRIGVIGGDIVFGQEKNPIRELEHTPRRNRWRLDDGHR